MEDLKLDLKELKEKTYELDKLREELKQLRKFLNIKKCLDCGSLSYKDTLCKYLCESCWHKNNGN